MNRAIIVSFVLIMLISVHVYGQNVDMQEAMLSQAGLSGAGITLINGDIYYRIQLQPELNLGKVGFGLDLVFLYNPDAGIRAEDGEKWGSFSDYLRAVRYVRYGHKSTKEPIYVLYGALDYATIGHGTIMGGYSNYDRRGLCLDLNVSRGMFGVETVLNNLANPTIFGGRFHVRPLQKEGIPLLSRLTFGATYLTDIDPAPNEEDEKPLVAFGVDAGVPIIDQRLMQMQLYDDIVLLRYQEKTRKGNATGISMRFMGGVNFKIEYRRFEKEFRPTIFNYTYENEKTKDGLKFEDKALKGIYSQLTYTLMNKVFLTGAYEDYDNRAPNLYVQLTERGLVEKVSFRALYTKDQIEGFRDIFDLDEKSLLTMRIGYEVFKPFEIAVVREWHFRKKDNGKGFETIRKTSVEVGVNMQF